MKENKEIIIYTASGAERFRTAINEGAKRKMELMKEDFIMLPFNVAQGIKFEMGDYCDIDLGDENGAINGRYVLRTIQKPVYDAATGGYNYNLQFDAWYYEWANKKFKYSPSSGSMEASFSLTADLSTHISVLLDNIRFHGFTYKGTAISVLINYDTATEAADVKLISYDRLNIVDALTRIAETFDCEWWITNNVIHLGRCHLGGNPYELSLETNLEELTPSDSKTEYFTRIIAFGSDRNIPYGYYDVPNDAVKAAVVPRRLRLPEEECPKGYYDVPGTTDADAVEGVVIFDNIYPRTSVPVTKVETYQSEILDDEENGTGEYETFYLCYFDHDAFPFEADDNEPEKDYRLPDTDLVMTFIPNNGKVSRLNGMSFVAQWHKPGDTVGGRTIAAGEYCFEIIANENYGIKLPNTTLAPAVGDTFSLTGWDSTKISSLNLIPAAATELYDAVVAFSEKSRIDPHVYTCKLLSDFAYGIEPSGELNVSYWQQYELGTPVLLKNDAFFDSGERISRVIGFELNLDIPYDTPTYIVGEKSEYSRLANVENEIKEIQMNGVSYTGVGGMGGTTIYVIKSNDNTSPTNSNVFSAIRSLKEFVSKKKDDIVEGLLWLRKGAWFGSTFWYIDDEGNARLNGMAVDSVHVHKGAQFDKGLTVGNFTDMSGGALVLDEDGHSYGEVDRLKVRMKAYFESLEVQEVNTVGGKVVISPAGAVTLVFVDEHRIDMVENGDGELEEVDNGIPEGVYRCYFLGEQDGVTLENRWKADDQAMSRTFNVTAGVHQGVSNHYYWRLVTAVSDQSTMLEKNGLKYHWIDLSKADCDTGSDIPVATDVVGHVGNRTDKTRQNALIFSSVDIYSPSVTLYHGIDNYTFLNKEYVEYGVNKSTDKAFFNVYGDFYTGDRRDGNEKEYVKYENGKVDIAGTLHIGKKSTIDGTPVDQYIKDNGGLTEEEVKTLIGKDIEKIQNQLDGAIETWFYSGEPTLTNLPASGWASDDIKDVHLGDLYYDKETGYGYRFMYDDTEGEYLWYRITDNDIIKALDNAAKAQETADGKMKVFARQPLASDSYDVGDLWVNATYPADGSTYMNDILRAVAKKEAGDAFGIWQWQPASKYTDDTKALQALAEIANTRNSLDSLEENVGKFKTDYDNFASDGVFTSAEVAALQEDARYVESIFQGAKGSYDKVISSKFLLDGENDSTEKISLMDAFNNLQAAKNELVAVIQNAVEDYKADNFEGAVVSSKYSNFNNAYNAFYQALNIAERYITDKTVETSYEGLDKRLTAIAKNFDTEIQGGLILSSMLALRGADGKTINAGINGVQKVATDIATWWGGPMKDRQLPDNTFAEDGATSLVRFDGSGYFANGAIWWDKTGQLHADPLSFFVGDNYVGLNLALFQFVPNNATRIEDVSYVIPQAPFKSLNITDHLSIGKIRLSWDAANNALRVENTEDGKTANLYATGGVSSLGFSPSGNGTGGGATSLSDLLDVSVGSQTQGQVLGWDGSGHWVPMTIQSGGGIDEGRLAQYLTANGYAKKNDIPSLSDYLKASDAESLYQPKGSYLTGITKAQVEAVLTGNITTHTHSQYLTSHQPLRTLTIQRNGTQVGTFKPDADATINITDVASAATLGSHTGNSTIHITAEERTAWNKVVSDFAAITGTDTDNIINKWQEVVDFLDTYTEADTLASLLSNKADKATKISAGTGLTGGGTLTADRTLSLATSGVTAGTYTKVTVDSYGRATIGAELAAADIPSLAISKISGLQDALNGKVSKAGDTMTGNLYFSDITANGNNNVNSNGISWNGGTDGARIFYRLTASDAGKLILNMVDDANTEINFEWSCASYGTTSIPYRFLHNSLIATNVGAQFKSLNIGGTINFSDLAGANVRDILYGKIADNDYFRIRVGGTASNAGYMEIATADDGNEPIYVRQYSGVFSTLVRTLTLLDTDGSTTIPSFLNVNGNQRIYSSLTGGGGDVYVELWRGINASWRLLNSGGYLKFQSNYINSAGDYFDCLKLDYNTGNTYIKGNVGIGKTSPAYKLDVGGSIIADSWIRTRNATGWYNETYGGGWYMSDSSWLRTHNSKGIFTNTGQIYTTTSVRIGDCTISWDSTNNALKFDKTIYSTGGVSALGAGTGSSGGGGLDWDALAASTNEQINKSHLSGAISEYCGIAQEFTARKVFNANTWILKSNEYNEIRHVYYNNNTIGQGSQSNLSAIRNAISFQWYDTNWEIGNVRGSGMNTDGFGIGLRNSSGIVDLGLLVRKEKVIAGGYHKIGYNDNYVLLAGGGAKAVSDFGSGGGGAYLPLTGGTITGILNITEDNFNTPSKIYEDSDGLNIYSEGQLYSACRGGLFVGYGDVELENGRVYAREFKNTSDIRKKNVQSGVEMAISAIADAPLFKFTWKDEIDYTGIHVGTSAQYWKTILPEVVTSDKKGYLSMQYDVIALLASVTTARKVVDHETRIKQLEKENEELRKMLNEIKAS